MKLKRTIGSLCLGLLLLTSPALAQQSDGPLDPNVQGRNDELREAFEGLNAQVLPHVVSIERKSQRGYGVVIEGGFVLTAASVVDKQGSYVARGQGFTLTADVLGRNRANGIALLKLRGDSIPSGLSLGSDGGLNIGQFVVTVGTDALPLAVGVVSAKNRTVEPAETGKNLLMGLFSDGNEGHTRHYPSVLHHDGAVAPEQFGSPVVDRDGKLVGINVAVPYRGSSHAVGIDHILTFLPALKAGTPERSPVETRTPAPAQPAPAQSGDKPWLGLSAVPAPEAGLHGIYAYGLTVNTVEAGGPAAAAGLRQGDVIVTVAGATFASGDAFANTLSALKPGDTLSVGYIRDAKLGETTITLGKRK